MGALEDPILMVVEMDILFHLILFRAYFSYKREKRNIVGSDSSRGAAKVLMLNEDNDDDASPSQPLIPNSQLVIDLSMVRRSIE